MQTESEKLNFFQKIKPIYFLFISSFFLLYEFILQISPLAMTHQIESIFGVNSFMLGLSSAIYYYSYAPLQPFVGLLYDNYGAKKNLGVAVFVCAVGVLLIGTAGNIFQVTMGRLLTGFGSAFAFVGVLYVGNTWFHEKYAGTIAGFAEIMGCIGGIVGSGGLAIILNQFSWRNIFIFLSFLGFFLFIIFSLTIREKSIIKNKKSIFYTAKREILSTIKNKQNLIVGFYAMLVFAPIPVFAGLWGAPFLMMKYGIGNETASLICSLVWMGIAIGSLLVGIVSDLLKNRRIFLILSPLLGIMTSIMIIFFHHSLIILSILLFIYGVSGLGQSLSFAFIRDITRSENIGIAFGVNNMFAALGAAFIEPLIGWLIKLNWQKMGFSLSTNYSLAFSLIVISFVAAFIISLFIKEQKTSRKET